ncbi:MAG TPA: hypothetical protein VFY18_14630 [Candidatus Limnocylindrales bacterium]|nr:hypothetical protein [Candidatus Limnocylindrales bacterium]
MSTTTMNDMPETAAAAVTEASRIAAQAARSSTETAKASIEAARTYVGESSTFGRDLLATWSTQSEGAIKAAFEAQNAAIDAGLNLFDMGVKGNRQAVEQFSKLVKQSQQATMDTWQTTVKAAAKVTEPTKR